MDFKPSKQGITNSEVREYALASTQKPSSSIGTVMALLAIMVPATGVYFWRTGALNGVFSSFGQSIPTMPSSGSEVRTAGGGAFASGGGDAMMQGYGAALSVQMNMDVLFEFVNESIESSIGAMNSKEQRWIPSDQLIAHCKQIARMQTADRRGTYTKNGAEMYNLMGERIYCLLTKRPEKLCDEETKGEVVRQYTMYHKVKHGALDMLMKSTELRGSVGRLDAGVHGAIKNELKKLGQRGYFASSDFGWLFPPADVKEVFKDIKGVKSACGA
jgi:hypothetical protein